MHFALVWLLCEFLKDLIYLGLYLDTVCVWEGGGGGGIKGEVLMQVHSSW